MASSANTGKQFEGGTTITYHLDWGLELIAALQRIQVPPLDTLLRAATSLGDRTIYLLFLGILFWSVDSGLAVRVALLMALSSVLNQTLKALLQQPRPFHLDPTLKQSEAIGYGLPSGHAQASVVQWGSLAAWFRRQWVWSVAVALVFLVGLSRVYLGVHFPTDVLAGWAIGAALVAFFFRGWGRGRLGSPLPRSIPTWDYRGSLWHRLARGVIGGLGFLLLQIALAGLLSSATASLVIIGLWIFIVAPWLFHRLGLTDISGRRTESSTSGASL